MFDRISEVFVNYCTICPIPNDVITIISIYIIQNPTGLSPPSFETTTRKNSLKL